MSENNMISTIEDVLGVTSNNVDTSRLSSSSNNDIYEAYIFFLVIDAARTEGASISYEDRSGNSAQSLVFRTSPGVIYSRAHNYTHALIEFDGAPSLEAHVGIKLVGKSLVSHEADVAVLNAETAINCRQNSKSPASAKALMAIECKHYTSHLQLHLARSFIGLVQDLSAKEPFFVSNTNSNSVERLLSKRVNNWERDISPTSSNGEVDRLFGVFRNVFKNYVAQNR